MLTDETINNEWRKANKQDDSWMPHIHARFARSIESAATTPLLAEIERLKERVAELEKLSVTNIMLSINPGWDGMGEEVYAKSVSDVEQKLSDMGQELEEWQLGIKRLHSLASNAQAEPLALERLSISEAKTIVSQHVEGEMTGDDWTIINAVQSAIAAKNGATLK